jgi:hypothetical protein
MASAAERPAARTRGLVFKTVASETLVYDLERHRAHSLNAVAAAVWRRCDGRRTPAAIAEAVAQELGVEVDALVVERALAQLGRSHLLLRGAPAEPRLGRREMLRRVGVAAAVVPVVTSIVAPRAADAQSAGCGAEGEPCSGGTCCEDLTCVVPGQGPPGVCTQLS